MFATKAWAYLKVAHSKGRLLALFANIKLARKKLATSKQFSLIDRIASDEQKFITTLKFSRANPKKPFSE